MQASRKVSIILTSEVKVFLDVLLCISCHGVETFLTICSGANNSNIAVVVKNVIRLFVTHGHKRLTVSVVLSFGRIIC